MNVLFKNFVYDFVFSKMFILHKNKLITHNSDPKLVPVIFSLR